MLDSTRINPTIVMKYLALILAVLTAPLMLTGCTSGDADAFGCATFLSEEGTMTSPDVDMTEGSEFGARTTFAVHVLQANN